MIGIVVLWFFGNLESKKFNNNIHSIMVFWYYG